MTTNQPVYKFLANLGDAGPLEYGGYFIYEDSTGVYSAQATLLETYDETVEIINRCSKCEDIESPCTKHAGLTYAMEYHFDLDRCTWINGILSDNKFHPDFPVWFASPETEQQTRPQDTTYLSKVAESIGMDLDELRMLFCSDNPVERAQAYRAVADYHGIENFDSYPLTWTVGQLAELKERFRLECTK